MSSLYNVTDWAGRFLEEYVQDSIGGDAGNFLSSETVVLVSGPASYPSDGTASLVPIGLVQNVQVSQQRMLQQIPEIGSKKQYFIPGRTQITVGVSSILFDGPSLMYAMSITKATGNSVEMQTWTEGDDTKPLNNPTSPITGLSTGTSTFKEGATPSTPGYFFINLASSFFNKPQGLGFIMYDAQQQPYGGFYLEGCYMQGHNFGVSSQQSFLVENVNLRATSLRPIGVDDL